MYGHRLLLRLNQCATAFRLGGGGADRHDASQQPQVVDVGGGTGFCTQGVVQHIQPQNVTLIDQSPHQLAKARGKPDLQGVTIMEVRRRRLARLVAVSEGTASYRHTGRESFCLDGTIYTRLIKCIVPAGRRGGPAVPYRQL
jgi:hypothetical protein